MAEGKALHQGAVVSQAKAKHTATVVFLHGRGDVGDGCCFVMSGIQPPHVKVICPHASRMPVTINGGARMPSWFDVFTLTGFGKQDEEGLMAAAKRVHELLDYEQEATGISSERIILGGLSQGGSLAMLAALTYSKPLAGIIALSTWMSLHEKIPEIMSPVNKETPFLHCHGKLDHLVPYETGEVTSQLIKTFNTSNYQLNTYDDLGHSFCQEEIQDMKDWIAKILPQTA